MTALTRRQILQAGGLAAATLVLPKMPAALGAPSTVAVAVAGDPLGRGYWVLLSDGTVVPRGTARVVGSVPALTRVTALTAAPRGGGFWVTKANGRTVGNDQARLSLKQARNRNSRVVGVAATPGADGLWRVTAEGQVLAAGSAPRLGRPRGNARIAGIAGHPESAGYWVVDRRGKVFGFGAARVLGRPVGRKVVGIAAHPGGQGYWVARADGQVFAFGASAHHGNGRLGVPVVGIAAAADGAGYWLVGQDGRVRGFGSARDGLTAGEALSEPSVTTVGGIVVASTIARRVRGLLAHANDDGIAFGGWGYRPFTRQIELRRQNCGPRYYDVWVKSSGECSPPTARPGSSMHEQGLAIDFYRRAKDGRQVAIAGTRAFKWMTRNAKTYGLYNLPSEPWHWSTNGR